MEIRKVQTDEQQYHTLFFRVIDKNVLEIKSRFGKSNIDPIIEMARIIKDGDEEALQKLKSRNIYQESIDFDRLLYEVRLWKHSKQSIAMQTVLAENRKLKLQSEMKIPKLLKTREDNLAAQAANFERKTERPYSIYELYRAFVQLDLTSTFHQLRFLIIIYLTIPVSSATAERAFSVLKRIKTWLRNSMGQERLSALSILNIEQELAASIDIDEIIKNFAAKKDRKCQF